MSSIDWKRVPRSGNFSFGKSKKSAGSIAGEFGGCSMIFVEFLARNSFKMIALWDGLSELVEQQRVSCPNSRLTCFRRKRHSRYKIFKKNIFSDSAHGIPFVMQNLRQILCSIFLSIGKITKHTWDKLTTSSTVNKLNDRSRSNSTSV